MAIDEKPHVHEEVLSQEHTMADSSLRERAEQVTWQIARRMVRPLAHPNLSATPIDYRPVRHAVLNPDIDYAIDTPTGEYPVYIFNRDALGDRSEQADIVMHMSLAVRADQGFVSPSASMLEKVAREQDRALIMIGAPGSNGARVSLPELGRLHLPGILESSHMALDGVAEQEQADLTRAVHIGASLGGYLALSSADPELKGKRSVAGLPEHEVVASIPIAPAGWKLRPMQRLAAAGQFMLLEPAHVIDKAAQMTPDQREEYLRSMAETIPHCTAIPGIGKLALEFLWNGNLSEVVSRLPRNLKIRGVAFDGDHVTIPNHLYKSFMKRDFTDSNIKIIDGRHLSLASFRKVMAEVVRPALDEDYAATI